MKNMAPSLLQTDVPIHVIACERDDFSFQDFAEHGICAPAHIVDSVSGRQAEYFFGRLAARHAVAPFGFACFTIGTGPAREPVWPPGIQGSITHNHRYAGAVALRDCEQSGIGIDIEEVIGPEKRTALASTVACASELAFLRALDVDLEFDVLLTLVFSAKESFFKAAYRLVGSCFDFDVVTILSVNVEQRMLVFRIERNLCPQLKEGGACHMRFAMVDSGTILTSCRLPIPR